MPPANVFLPLARAHGAACSCDPAFSKVPCRSLFLPEMREVQPHLQLSVAVCRLGEGAVTPSPPSALNLVLLALHLF